MGQLNGILAYELHTLSTYMKRGLVKRFGCWALLSLSLVNTPTWSVETGGLEGDFLSWGAGARALGLGKAFSAVVDDASATYWNPAGLASLQRGELTGLHAQLWEGTTFDFFSAALPTLVEGTFGWQTVILASNGGERRDADNTLLDGSFGVVKAAFGPSWALPLSPWLSMGVTVKYLGRWVDSVQSGFLTGDAGWLVKLPYDLTLALTGKHLLAWRQGATADTLTPQWRLGAAWRPLYDLLLVSFDVEQSGHLHVGMEMAPLFPFVLRAGTDRLESGLSAGMRLDDIGLDYTASLHQEFGLSHRMSFTVQFGDALAHVRLSKAREACERALDAYDAGDAETARRLSDEVLRLDPENVSASFLKNKLQR